VYVPLSSNINPLEKTKKKNKQKSSMFYKRCNWEKGGETAQKESQKERW